MKRIYLMVSLTIMCLIFNHTTAKAQSTIQLFTQIEGCVMKVKQGRDSAEIKRTERFMSMTPIPSGENMVYISCQDKVALIVQFIAVPGAQRIPPIMDKQERRNWVLKIKLSQGEGAVFTPAYPEGKCSTCQTSK